MSESRVGFLFLYKVAFFQGLIPEPKAKHGLQGLKLYLIASLEVISHQLVQEANVQK